MEKYFPPELDARIPAVFDDLMHGIDEWILELEGDLDRDTLNLVSTRPLPLKCVFTSPPTETMTNTTKSTTTIPSIRLFRVTKPSKPPTRLFKRPIANEVASESKRLKY